MPVLTQVTQPGAFIIMALTAKPTLVKHLGEMGLRVGSRLTLIQTARQTTGVLVYFQGQRLAVSSQIADCITVAPLTAVAEAQLVSLATVKPGRLALVGKINGQGALRQRLLDMGLTRGTMLKVVRVAPLGDPLEVTVRGYQLSLRKADATAVLVTEVNADA